MAEETTQQGAGASDGKEKDAFGNFKAEMDRKMANVTDQLKSTTELLKQQLAKMDKPQQRDTADDGQHKSFRDKFYENEDAAIDEVLTAREQRIYDNIARENKKTAEIGRLYNDFPELSDKEHPLTKKAVELWESLPKEERNNSVSYKASVLEAATTLGVLPKSKRERESVDEYQGSGNDRGAGKDGKREPQIDLEFAKKMGLNVNDEKVVARIKARASRQNWGSYQ